MNNERYLIVGMGSIGRRHLECLRTLKPDAEITVWRQHHRDEAVPEGASRVVFSLNDALNTRPHCAIVANPASMHIDTGLALAEAGVHLLIEKPLSVNTDRVDQLIQHCKNRQLVLMVAYVLRFDASLSIFKETIQSGKIGRVVSFRAEVGQYLPDWRPGSDYRTGVSARKELGGGALLELSHELDYIRWIFGDVLTVSALMANSGILEIDVEDQLEAILQIRDSNGVSIIGSVHLDMLQRAPTRTCRAIGETGTLEWNAVEGVVRCFDAESKTWHTLYQATPAGRNALYIRQLESFLDAVRNGCAPLVTGEDGLAVLQTIQAVRDSALNRIEVTLPCLK